MKLLRSATAQVTLSAAVAATLAAPASTSLAGEPAATGERRIEEVVVTARFREERLQETPLAITALSAEDLTTRAFSSAAEVASTVPNARFAQAQAAYGKAMTAYIRGVGQYDFNPAFEPGVGIYVDDTYHASLTGSLFELLDLERVEVLRGPQGTLFGRGAIGGAMRLVTKKPVGDGSGLVSVTGGELDRIEIKGSYDFSIIEDKLFARVSASSRNRKGYQEVIDFACANPSQAGTLPVQASNRAAGCVIDHYGDEDVTGARLALRLLATDELELNFSGDYTNDRSGPAADTLVSLVTPTAGPFGAWNNNVVFPAYGIRYDSRFLNNDPLKTYATYADPITGYTIEKRNSVRIWGITASADYAISENVAAKLVLSHRDWLSQLAHDSDGSPLNLQTVNGVGEFEGNTAELRFNGLALGDRLDWTTGAFWYDSTAGNAQAVSIPAFVPNGFVANSDHKVDNENKSAYVHGVFRATDQLGLTAGVRYSKDTRTFHFNDSASGIVRDMDASGSSTDYKVGADFKFTDDLMVYASVATGYKPKAFNPRPFQASQLVPVDGEELQAYELGMKSDWFDRRLRSNVAVFYSDYKKRIISRPGVECRKTPEGVIIPSNAAGSVPDPEGSGQTCLTVSRTNYVNVPGEVTGVEVELTFQPVDQLTITAGGGITEFEADNLLGGSMPVYVPERNLNVGVSYDIEMAGGATITPRADYYKQSEICYTLNPITGANPAASCAEGYFQVNARVDFATSSRDWTVGLGVTNVTEEEYFYNIFDLTAFGQPTIEGTPSRPREWYLTVTRQFK
jgi:iron complex outermembrane recepter protein